MRDERKNFSELFGQPSESERTWGDRESQRIESKKNDAQAYSEVLARIQAENPTLPEPTSTEERAILSEEIEVQSLRLIHNGNVSPSESSTWLKSWEIRTSRLKKAA